MLAFAKKASEQAELARPVYWLGADAKDTGLPAKSFDVVFSNSILHHIADTEAFWAEVKRLCKQGGFVFIRDLARPASDEDARDIVKKYGGVGPELMQRDYYNSLLAAYTVSEVRAQLDAAGLEAIEATMVSDRHWDAFGRLT